MDEGVLGGVVMVGIFCALCGLCIGGSRGRPGAGFLCGFLLGPLGVVIAFFLPKDEKLAGIADRPKTSVPIHLDPLEAWEAKEKAKTVLQVPEHLRGRKFED